MLYGQGDGKLPSQGSAIIRLDRLPLTLTLPSKNNHHQVLQGWISDPITDTAGVSFAAVSIASFIWITDNASILKVESVTLMGALVYASQKSGHVVIHTDSRAAIDNLQQSMPNNNIHNLTTILVLTQHILGQLVEPLNDMNIKTGKGLSRHRLETGHAGILQRHTEEIRASPSARWYGDEIGYEPLIFSTLRLRGDKMIMHRLRLGY